MITRQSVSAHCLIVAALFAYGIRNSVAQAPSLAPLNQEWIEFQEQLKVGAIKKMTKDGYPLGLVPSPGRIPQLAGRRNEMRDSRARPSSYDLRTLGRTTEVRDQRPYGTCWAFASYCSMEGNQLPGITNNFSENHLANCHGFDFGYDDGGNCEMTAAYAARWAGPVDESDDPYPNPGGSDTNMPPSRHVQAVMIIPDRTSASDNEGIKNALMTSGPVCSGMHYDDAFFNANSSAYCYNGTSSWNHAITIVGWDDDFSATNFPGSPAGGGAFIVQNSWGTNWADKGFFHISYHDALIGQRNFVFHNSEATDNFTDIYQHDFYGQVGWGGYGGTSSWGANVFSARESGTLKAISFHTVSDDTTFNASIYTGVSSNNPESGTLMTSQGGSVSFAGYHTIELDYPVSIESNSAFSVVVQFASPGYDYPLPMEYPLPLYTSKARSSTGESFTRADSGSWVDITSWLTNGNICIKAFFGSDIAAPTGVAASDGTYTDRVEIAWNAVTNATGYAVWRGLAASSSSSELLAVTTGVCYADTSAEKNTVYYYWVRATNAAGSSGFGTPDSGYRRGAGASVLNDYDGDGKSDLAVYHQASGWWFIKLSNGDVLSSQKFGESDYSSVSGDFDGDSKSDLALYHESSGYWYILKSSDGSLASTKWGAAGYAPVPADYDGDGIADLAVYCETGDWPGYWYVLKSTDFSMAATKWGAAGYAPVPADYDGDGIADLAVYCETGDWPGYWYVLKSTDFSMAATKWGDADCTPVPGDYDGDGLSDIAVYHEQSGWWYILQSSTSDIRMESLGGSGYSAVR